MPAFAVRPRQSKIKGRFCRQCEVDMLTRTVLQRQPKRDFASCRDRAQPVHSNIVDGVTFDGKMARIQDCVTLKIGKEVGVG